MPGLGFNGFTLPQKDSATPGTAFASGMATSSNVTSTFTLDTSGTINTYSITVPGLSFIPSRIIIVQPGTLINTIYDVSDRLGTNAATHITAIFSSAVVYNVRLTDPAVVGASGFTLPINVANTPVNWYAYK